MNEVTASTANLQSENGPQFSVTPPPKKLSPIFLIILGILVSLGAAAFIWLRPFSYQQPATPIVASSPSPSAKPLTLELTSPSDGTLSINQEILVTGKTLPNTTVVFYTDTDENSIESDVSGMFESTVTLTQGINTLTVTAFGEDGTEKSQTMDLVYDTES